MKLKAPPSYSPVHFAAGRSLQSSPTNNAAVSGDVVCNNNQVGMNSSPAGFMPTVAEESFNATAKTDTDRVYAGLQENLEMSEQAVSLTLYIYSILM